MVKPNAPVFERFIRTSVAHPPVALPIGLSLPYQQTNTASNYLLQHPNCFPYCERLHPLGHNLRPRLRVSALAPFPRSRLLA